MRMNVLCGVLVAVTACASGGSNSTRSSQTKPDAEYRLGPEDVVEVVVWKEPGLSTTTPVRPDGRINVPLAGELPAAGRTARELEKEIATRLATTITSPVVAVLVKEFNATRVFVVGEVSKPGVYPIRGRLTVLQALALAGGLTEFADRGDIVVLRRNSDGSEQKIGVDYGDAVGGDGTVELAPGDTVVVK